MDIRRVLARNTIWNYTGFAVNLVANLFMFPYVVRHIGDAATGVWLLLSSITGYMGLLELGIVPSLTQTIAASLAKGERDAVSRAASSAQAVLIGLGVVALLLFPFSATAIHFLAVPPVLEDAAALTLRLTIVGFALRMPLAAFQGILLGSQRQDRCNQLWIVMAVAKCLCAVAVLETGHGLVALVVAELTVHLFAGLLQVKWVYDEVPALRMSCKYVNRADVGRLMSFGGAMLAVTVCSLIIEQTDRMVIAIFLPVDRVTYYAAAWKIYMLAAALTTTFAQAVSPIAASLHGRHDEDGLRHLFSRFTKFTTLIAWPLVLTLCLSGGFILRFWMGERFVNALRVAQVLMIAFAVTAYNHTGYSILVGTRRVGPTVSRYFLPQAILNLILSVWLVQRMGNVGVALGTMLPALGLEYVFLSFVLRELRVTWRELFNDVVAPIAGPALLAFLPLAVAYSRLDAASPLLLLIAAPCACVYVVAVWYLLDDDERSQLLGYVPAVIRGRVAAVFALYKMRMRQESSV